ncbi:MAG TPA: helix-turn-helix domain-containing GNAT family N-acetyltransferase [Kofleriaceae bacterium]
MMQRNGWQAQADLFPEVAPLRQASRQLVRELGFLDDGQNGLGITHSQCHTLIELERQERLTAGELAQALNLDKSTMSRTVAGLVKRGYVVMRAEPGDRRRRQLALTASGRRKVVQIHRQADGDVQAALAALPADERAAAVRGLSLYAGALARRRARAGFAIRPITRRDDRAMGGVIRTVMTEFGASGPGFAIHDPEVDEMSRTYRAQGSAYWVVVRGDRVVGGGGYGRLTGAGEEVCELRKMYFLPETRGVGMGATLLAYVLDQAARAGYRVCYLETLVSMTAARRLYEAFGFRRIDGPMGATGHFSCDAYYVRDLAPPP